MMLTKVLAANESQALGLAGNRFWFRSGSGQIQVKLNSAGLTKTYDLTQGQGVDWLSQGTRFNSIEIKNISSAAQQVNFEVTEAEVFDNSITGEIFVILQGAPSVNMPADFTVNAGATANIVANSVVNKLLIQSAFANGGIIRVGPGAAAGTGFELPPGGNWPFNTGQQIDIHNPLGAPVTVRYYQELTQ